MMNGTFGIRDRAPLQGSRTVGGGPFAQAFASLSLGWTRWPLQGLQNVGRFYLDSAQSTVEEVERVSDGKAILKVRKC
jgi:hypothetical protein